MSESEFVDWETDEWPKECECGYVAEDEQDAIFHAFDTHPEWVIDTDEES